MRMDRLVRYIARQWHQPTAPGQLLLRPLAMLYAGVTALRRVAYRTGLRRTRHLSVPVVVVGNLTVGGSGKTPLVAYLAEALCEAGWNPGIVSRGHGGRERMPRIISPDDDPRDCGDEPLMLASRTGLPVAVGIDRPAAARLLEPQCDVVLSDDGLQHLALGRDIEIIVVDDTTIDGTDRLLPAGPFREHRRRLEEADFIAVRDGTPHSGWHWSLALEVAVSLQDGTRVSLQQFADQPLHAIAGIGRPGRFFDQLEAAGLAPERHPFADHHSFTRADLDFADQAPVLMTEKDAVKCRRFADERLWAVPAMVVDRDGLAQAVHQRLLELRN